MPKRDKREKRKKIKYGSAKNRADNFDSGRSSKAFRLPQGMKKFRFSKEGTYLIDIIPYVVGENNPCADPGSVYYERTFYVHKNIGPNQDSYTCNARTFGKSCPICEQRAKLRRDPEADKDELKALNDSERQLFIIKDLKNPDDGFQLFEYSNFLFGKLLDTRIKGADDDDDYENFFHLDAGQSLKLTVTEESMPGGGSFYKVTAIDFKPRKEQYDETTLEEVPCLDELVIETPYEKLKKAFLAISDDKDSSDDDNDNDDEGEIEVGAKVTWLKKNKLKTGTVKKINNKTGLVSVKIKGQDELVAVELDELSLIEDEGSSKKEKKMAKKDMKKGNGKKRSKEDDEDEEDEDEELEDEDENEDEDEDEDDEPKKKKKKGKKSKDDDDDDDDDDEDDDDDDDDEEDEDDDDEEDEDDEDDEEEPKKKKGKKDKKSKKGKKSKDEDDDDDEEDEDDDDDDDIPFDEEDEDEDEDEPKKKKKKKKK